MNERVSKEKLNPLPVEIPESGECTAGTSRILVERSTMICVKWSIVRIMPRNVRLHNSSSGGPQRCILRLGQGTMAFSMSGGTSDRLCRREYSGTATGLIVLPDLYMNSHWISSSDDSLPAGIAEMPMKTGFGQRILLKDKAELKTYVLQPGASHCTIGKVSEGEAVCGVEERTVIWSHPSILSIIVLQPVSPKLSVQS